MSSSRGYNEFYVSLNTVGDYVFVLSDDFMFFEDSSHDVTVTVHVVPPPINGTNLGVCTQCQLQAGAPINLTNGNVWIPAA